MTFTDSNYEQPWMRLALVIIISYLPLCAVHNGWYVLQRPAWEGSVARVVVVRHGMAHHNDLMGAKSVISRDAALNCAGEVSGVRCR